MAVTMSETTASRDSEIRLRNTTVDTSVVSGGATSTMVVGGGGMGATVTAGVPLVGITASFATNVCRAIEEYSTNIQNRINEMESIDSTGAFRGEAVTAAIANFITGVREVANAYIVSLQRAEQEITNNVHNVFSQQDTNISGNLNTDSNTLTSEMPHL